MFRTLIATFLLAFAAVLPAGAAVPTWTGAGATNHWSDAGNWQGGVVPTSADRAAFTGLGSSSFVVVDTPVTIVGIDFSGEITYSLSGNLVTLTGASPATVTSSTGGNFTLSTGVTFAAASAVISVAATQSPGPQLKFLQGLTTFSGGSVQIQAGTAPFGQVILDNVRQTAATSIVVSGNAAFFNGNNVLTGPVTSNARSLGGSGVKPFGAAAVVMQQGALSIFSASSGTTIGPLTLHAPLVSTNVTPGSLLNANGALRIQGAADISSQQVVNAQANITVTGKLTGGGAIEITGPGTVELDGSSGSFNGSLVVDSPATLLFAANSAIDSSARLGSTGGSIVIDSTTQNVSSLSCAGPLEIALAQGSLNVQGAVSADGCALTLDVPATLSPVVGTTYPLITNGSQNPLPTFAGVPDGAVVNANGTAMTVSYHGGRSGRDLVVVATGSSQPPPLVGQLTDMWWGGPVENGWGLSIIQHVDTLFGALYIYDANGNPVWLVMPGGHWDATHVSYTGALYEPISSPYFAYDPSRFVVGSVRGSLTITFIDASNATLDYAIDGNPGHKVIEREIFGNGAPSAVDYSDLWWGGTSQNGWGMTILQQGTTLFPVWYTYDANGNPFWYVMPDGTWNAAGDTYSGNMYRTTSSPWIVGRYDATQLKVISAGTYSLRFSGTGATFSYTADGHSGSMALVREPF